MANQRLATKANRFVHLPCVEGRLHWMYSVNKTVIGIAVGMLIDERELQPDDCIVDYFPNMNPIVKKLRELSRIIFMEELPHPFPEPTFIRWFRGCKYASICIKEYIAQFTDVRIKEGLFLDFGLATAKDVPKLLDEYIHYY